MDWKTLRTAFIKARGTRTQGVIAKHGGIRQSDVSKLEANDNLGPQVETFVKAIQGLGMAPSAFFLQIENSQSPALTGTTSTPKDEPLFAKGAYGRSIPDVDAIVDEVLIQVGTRIATAARSPGQAERSRRAIPRARAQKHKDRKRGA